MFVGHLALGFAAKRVVPRVSLPMLFVAVQWADLVWPVLVALGLEQVRIDPGNTPFTALDFVSYPYSHSLVFLAGWGVLLGAIYWLVTRDRPGSVVLSALVLSHWLLDVVTHRPDMPIYPGGAKFGLGLWYSIPATLAVELLLYGAGLWIYVRATEPRDRVGRWGLATLAAFLVVVYLAAIGNAPPSMPALYIPATAGAALLTVWAWRVDRHRAPRPVSRRS